MNQDNRISNQTATCASAGEPLQSQPYVPPQLKSLGLMADLTQGVGSTQKPDTNGRNPRP